MIDILFYALIVALAAGRHAISRSTRRARLRMWRDAFTSCDVAELSPSSAAGFPHEVCGRKGNLDVEIGSYHGQDSKGTRIVVHPLAGVDALRLRVEDGDTTIMKRMGIAEVEVGDPDFDHRFMIGGPTPLALAVLDAAMRRQVGAAMGGETVVEGTHGGVRLKATAELANGRLTVEIQERGDTRLAERLPGALGTILALAKALAAPRDVPHQLTVNARRDPLWAVRLANLRTLAREWPDHAETTDTLRAACGDPNEEVRLQAAVALGREADATLVALAFGEAPDALAARAVAALEERVPFDRAVHTLGAALATGRLETACACIAALGRSATPGAATPEPLLVDALAHADKAVRIAGARGLGPLGSIASVLPLQEAAQRFGGELRSVSRQSVAEIQSRLSGAMPGQLSVSSDAGGAVSIASEGGEVSLDAEPQAP